MNLGRALITIGLVILVLGVVVAVAEKFQIHFGRLPGDFVVRGKHSVFYFPLATCLLLSVVLSLVVWLLGRR